MSSKDIPQVVARPSKKIRQVPLSTMILTVVLVAVGSFVIGTRSYMIPLPFSKTPSQLELTSLNNLYSTLKSRFDGDIDASKLIDGAKHGLVEATGDPYTVYFNAEETAAFNSDLNGTFEGIGAELSKVDGSLTILGVVADSPAQSAGLKAKDVIYKVNDEETSSMTVAKAVKNIRGPKGTTVKLSIIRGDEAKDYTITRDKISTPSVKTEILEGNIGYIRLSRFGDDTSRLATKAAEDFKSKGVDRIILDLRGNGGGLLTAAQDISGLWLKNKVVVTQRHDGVVTDTLKSESYAPLEGIKTVILVDGGSASASEIVAGALKDYKVATLIGEKTYGKGSVQAPIPLGDGGELKVTIAKWFTPNGKNIDKEGIAPDKEVKLSDDDIKAGRDPQKDSAIEFLKR